MGNIGNDLIQRELARGIIHLFMLKCIVIEHQGRVAPCEKQRLYLRTGG